MCILRVVAKCTDHTRQEKDMLSLVAEFKNF